MPTTAASGSTATAGTASGVPTFDDEPAAQPQPPAPDVSAPQQSAFAAGSQQLTCAAGAQHALTTPAAAPSADPRSTPIPFLPSTSINASIIFDTSTNVNAF